MITPANFSFLSSTETDFIVLFTIIIIILWLRFLTAETQSLDVFKEVFSYAAPHFFVQLYFPQQSQLQWIRRFIMFNHCWTDLYFIVVSSTLSLERLLDFPLFDRVITSIKLSSLIFFDMLLSVVCKHIDTIYTDRLSLGVFVACVCEAFRSIAVDDVFMQLFAWLYHRKVDSTALLFILFRWGSLFSVFISQSKITRNACKKYILCSFTMIFNTFIDILLELLLQHKIICKLLKVSKAIH